MKKNVKVQEKFVYEIWKEQNFVNDLTTKDGQKITVIDVGVQNSELGGPDFKNARIKIGNITYLGDVEIDTHHSDWKNHGHNLNKKYNKVVLHAILNNDSKYPFVFTQDGRKVQSICISENLADELSKNVQKAILSERKNRINKMPCAELNALVDEKKKLDFIFELGVLRFRKKSERMLDRLKEIAYLKSMYVNEPMINYELDENFHNKKFAPKDFQNPEDWQQLIYESIFEALGYSKNKEIMQNLAKAAEISFIKTFSDSNDFLLHLESALFSISGLLPDVPNLPDEETSGYTKKMYEYWAELKPKYDSRIFNAAQWHFFRLRPQNFPTIRIAGGVRIVNKIINQNLIGEIISKVEEVQNPGKLISELRNLLIIKGEGFWHTHYVFDQPAKTAINYFVGASRADEIIVNILLPIISIYFEIFDKKELSQKVLQVYLNYFQKSENNLVNEVSSTLSLNDAWKRSVLYQGMIELFRSYCTREKCLECNIGKQVFG